MAVELVGIETRYWARGVRVRRRGLVADRSNFAARGERDRGYLKYRRNTLDRKCVRYPRDNAPLASGRFRV